MLLVGAGLLIKSFARLQNVNPGFATENVLTAQMALPATRYPDQAARTAFWQRLLQSARAIPGVTTAGLTSNVPFNGNVSSGSYSIVGYTPGPSEAAPHGRQEVVGGDYFRAMQIPLIEGRLFNDGDTAESPRGRRRRSVPREPVFRRPQPARPADPAGRPDQPAVHDRRRRRHDQQHRPRAAGHEGAAVLSGHAAAAGGRGMALVLKTGLDPTTLVPQVRAAVQSIDPEQPIADVRTMDQWMSRSLELRRTPMVLLALFGGVALVLSAIGIYGVLAFGVAQRVREFGIRQALGADRRSILSLVLRQGLRTAGVGLVLGLGGALLLSRFLQSLLFGVGQHDLVVFAGVTVLLLGVATAACYIPARKATRIDPMVALRE